MHKFDETENFLGYFLYASNNNVNLNSFTLLDMYYDEIYTKNIQAKMFLEKSPLVNYVKSNFLIYNNENKQLVIQEIINAFNYNFFLISKDEHLPDFLNQKVKKENYRSKIR